MPKKKPPPSGGKKARDKDDQAIDKAHKGDNTDGSFRALRRLIGGK